jgi:tRNA wybutosine-synthesizing protein 1
MDEAYKKLLLKQQYRFLGEHTTLKICGWTKKSISNKGTCYKEQFYGIRAHQCVQMSPATNICNFDCLICWRKRHNEPFTTLDDPKEILSKIPTAQYNLLSGLGGFEETDQTKWKESATPKHIAISLTGEATLYPKLNEFIKESHKANYSTFLVTNGSTPKVLETIEPPTQLYISLDAPNEELFLKIDRPENKSSWKDLMKSLDILKNIKTRTAIRVTLIKNYNIVEPENYAKIIEDSAPLFVEVKSYMSLGESRQRLEREDMPSHEEIRNFSEEICKHCDYKIIDEHPRSRVTLLMKEDTPDRIMKF